MRNYSGSFIVPVVISALIVVVTIILMIWGIRGAIGADNVAPCLTKAQARAKYQNQWIYWHGVNKCWDNIPVRSVKSGTPPPPLAAKSNATPLGDQNITPGPTIFYPALMGGGGTIDAMLTPHVMSHWPLVADFDVDPPAFIPWRRVSALIK